MHKYSAKSKGLIEKKGVGMQKIGEGLSQGGVSENKKPSSSHSSRAFLWVESGEVISDFFYAKKIVN
jgi:hypothetical protein